MRPIPEWRQAWRLFSIQIGTAAIAWGAVPADQQAAILAAIGLSPARVPAVLGALFVAGRLFSQKGDK